MEDIQNNLGELLIHDLNNIKDIRSLAITLHLYIELLINTFLEVYFVNPKHLPVNFMSKFKIVKAIGFLDNNLCKNIEKINQIRNKFAHTFDIANIPFDFGGIKLTTDEDKFSQISDSSLKLKILAVDTIEKLHSEITKFLHTITEIYKKGVTLSNTKNKK